MAAAGNRNARGESLKTFKRRHILDAARRLFDARGMEGLNMRAIADEAGYSLGAAYAYFRTKEEIQIELLAATFAEIARRIRAAALRDGSSPLAGFHLFMRYFRDRPAERALLLATLPEIDKPAMRAARKEFDSRLFTLLGLLANALHHLGGATPSQAQEETMDFFTYLLGLLMLQSGGSLSRLGQPAQEMVDRYGEQVLLRITR